MKRVETILVAFVASFFLTDLVFVILLPNEGLEWSLEASGILFIILFLVTLLIGLADYTDPEK